MTNETLEKAFNMLPNPETAGNESMCFTVNGYTLFFDIAESDNKKIWELWTAYEVITSP